MSYSVYEGSRRVWSKGVKRQVIKVQILSEVNPTNTNAYKKRDKENISLQKITMKCAITQLQESMSIAGNLYEDFSNLVLYYDKQHDHHCFLRLYRALKHSQHEPTNFMDIMKKGQNIHVITMENERQIEEDALIIVFAANADKETLNDSSTIFALCCFPRDTPRTLKMFAEYLIEKKYFDPEKTKAEDLLKDLIFNPTADILKSDLNEKLSKIHQEMKINDPAGNLKLTDVVDALKNVVTSEEGRKRESDSKKAFIEGDADLVVYLKDKSKMKANCLLKDLSEQGKKASIKISLSDIVDFTLRYDDIAYKEITTALEKVNQKDNLATNKKDEYGHFNWLQKVDFYLPYYYLVDVRLWNSVINLYSDLTIDLLTDYVKNKENEFINNNYKLVGFIIKKDNSYEVYQIDKISLAELAEKTKEDTRYSDLFTKYHADLLPKKQDETYQNLEEFKVTVSIGHAYKEKYIRYLEKVNDPGEKSIEKRTSEFMLINAFQHQDYVQWILYEREEPQ